MAHIVDVIKYEGDNSTFVWKHPREDFNRMTQLVVHESQEAVFFMNGQALDHFGPGRYTLETQNLPLVGRMINRIAGGDSPFHCEVYFINKTVQMAVKWGTDTRVHFLDPKYGVPLEIGASGEMNLMVSDARKLLIKLVGTTKGIAWNREDGEFTKSLTASFRPMIVSAVKTNLPTCIKSNNIDILEIDEKLGYLSSVLKDAIQPGMEEYGLTIPEFYVTTVLLPENDPNFRRIRDLHTVSLQQSVIQAETTIKTAMAESSAAVTAAQRQIEIERQMTETEMARHAAERDLIQAQAEAQVAKLKGFAEAEVMRAQGYTKKDAMQVEVQKAYAEGLGNMTITGGVAGDVIGLGVGLAAAGAVSGQLGEMVKGFQAPAATAVCTKCGAQLPDNAKFCLECGTKVEHLAENEMICPACGQKTNKGKFCMECGASLILKCAKCGNELPSGAKFCLECGEKL